MNEIKNKIDEIIIGISSPSKELKRLIQMVSKSKTNVLVLGETGTGKELVAKAIHNESNRKGPNPDFLIDLRYCFGIIASVSILL